MREASTTEVQKRFSEFIDVALTEPVTIRRHNRDTVVLVSAVRFKEMEAALANPMYAHEIPNQLASEVEAADYGK